MRVAVASVVTSIKQSVNALPVLPTDATDDTTFPIQSVQPRMALKDILADTRSSNSRCTLYAFFVCRTQYISEGDEVRAQLCQTLAVNWVKRHRKVINEFDLVERLVASFILPSFQDGKPAHALELAIQSHAKEFIALDGVQQILRKIYNGQLLFQTENPSALLRDTYKRRGIHYHTVSGPLLDHYRLKVPLYRAAMEYVNYVVLCGVYALTVTSRSLGTAFSGVELLLVLLGLGFALDKLAGGQEHGWRFYSKNLWNGLDLLFVACFLSYLTSSIYAFLFDAAQVRRQALDWLTCASTILIPRIVFVTLSGNMLILSLRALIVEFIFLVLIGALSFSGFAFALWQLSAGQFTLSTVASWMLSIFFGLDSTGFDRSADIHPTLGPALIVIYACLSNTLLVTILVAILSNTFSIVHANAAQEQKFRFACSTLEKVKSDALFSYSPPFNLAALLFLAPLKRYTSERWFHSANVAAIRFTSAPFLLAISFYERCWLPQISRRGGHGSIRLDSHHQGERLSLIDSESPDEGDVSAEIVADVQSPNIMSQSMSMSQMTLGLGLNLEQAQISNQEIMRHLTILAERQNRIDESLRKLVESASTQRPVSP